MGGKQKRLDWKPLLTGANQGNRIIQAAFSASFRNIETIVWPEAISGA
jgi:hypothetical protein